MGNKIFRSLKICFLIGYYLLSQSCNTQEISKDIVINTPDHNQEIEFNLSDLCSEVMYVSIDNEIPISSIKKMQFGINLIVIRTTEQGVLLFDMNGKFIRKIGSYGDGPNEYKKISTFTINDDSDKIFILTGYNNILVFNISGSFLYSFKLNDEFKAKEIIAFSNDKLLFLRGNAMGDANINWILTDLEGKPLYVKENFVKFKGGRLAGPSPEYILFKGAGKYNYFEQYNDTIFQIEDGSYNVHSYLKIKDRITPKIAENEGILGAGDKYFLPRDFFETEKSKYMTKNKTHL